MPNPPVVRLNGHCFGALPEEGTGAFRSLNLQPQIRWPTGPNAFRLLALAGLGIHRWFTNLNKIYAIPRFSQRFPRIPLAKLLILG